MKRQNNIQKIILFLYIVTLNAVSGFSYIKLPDVVVVGSRTGGEAARDVQIYTSLDFLNICPATIDSIIEIFSSLYVMNRGPRGVQQDINISGSGYEQTLILFDGIPVNDPQTGHFNMNIPVSPIAIKRVEVLTGHGSVSHGSGAMGGVINIVPGQTSSGSKLLIYSGSYSTFGGELVSSQERNGAKNLLSLSMRKTGNYHPQTDSLIFSLFNMSQYKGLKFSAGYMNKEFGAYDFYTPDWEMPSREWNEAFILTSSYRKEISDFILTPAFMWRRHIDKYVLKADNPDFYKNNHTNDLIATLINLRYKNLALGFETRDEYLDSSGMGKHYRQILSYFGEYTYKPHTSILFSAGARYEGIFIPRLSLGWWINENIKLRSAWGKSFRRPTFTDLYYISSANFGNENLKLEKAENFEIGFDLKFSDKLKFKTTLFYRKFKDLIDWAGDTEEGPWRAGNRGKQDLNGINTNIEYNFNSVKYTLGYSYVDIKKDTDYYSKYALKYLRHRISFLAEIYLFAGVSFNISGEWGIPVQRAEESFGKMNCVLKKNFDEVEVFLKIENIGNSKYSDFSGIPVPGRWITAGINW